jgi:hypothetical protein
LRIDPQLPAAAPSDTRFSTVPADMFTAMTNSTDFDFHLNRPGALIAAIPAVLGFVPEESLVLVTLEAGEMGAVIRADLADDTADMTAGLDQLCEVAASGGADAAVAVIVDPDGLTCRMCIDEYRMLAAVLETRLGERGIEVLAVHVVDRIAAGGRWQCADGCGNHGVIDDPAASPLALAAVLDGRRLYARRTELLEVIGTVAVERTESIRCIIEKRSGATDVCARKDSEAGADVEHALAVARQLADGTEPTDTDLAALAYAVVDPRVRDTLYALAVGVFAGEAEELWALLARTLPPPWRLEALVLLAFSAYARGDGPLAGVALEAALDIDGAHRMAGMLDTALQTGLRPEQIRELALTGYRMADRLGIVLPPRREFGRSA